MARKGIVSRSYAAARDSVSSRRWNLVYLASAMAFLSLLLLVGVSGIPSISAALQSYWLAPKGVYIDFVPDAPIGRVDIEVTLNRDLSFKVRERTVKVFSDPSKMSHTSAKLIPLKTGTTCHGEDAVAIDVVVKNAVTWNFNEANSISKNGSPAAQITVPSRFTLIPIESSPANVRQLDKGVSEEVEIHYTVEGIFRERGTLLPLITPPSIAADAFSVSFERPEVLGSDLEVALCWGKDAALSELPLKYKTTTLDGNVITTWESDMIQGGSMPSPALPTHTTLALALKPIKNDR